MSTTQRAHEYLNGQGPEALYLDGDSFRVWSGLVRELLTAEAMALSWAETYKDERDSMYEALTSLQNSLEPDRTRRAQRAERERDELRALIIKVEKFITDRTEYITALNNSRGDDVNHDYWRWQGGAEARRQLAESLGIPVPHNAGDRARILGSANG